MSAGLFGESIEEFRVESASGDGEMVVQEPAKRLKPIDRRQCYWGAIDMEKLIAEDHPARGIWAMVNQLDLTALEAKIKAIEGRAGQSSLDPRLLIALWIYGYSEGINSARELSRMCDYEPGCQWLTAMQSVNYHTLSDFRVDHKKELDRIFVQVLGLLSAEGLIEMKRITQDGTKVRASPIRTPARARDGPPGIGRIQPTHDASTETGRAREEATFGTRHPRIRAASASVRRIEKRGHSSQ